MMFVKRVLSVQIRTPPKLSQPFHLASRIRQLSVAPAKSASDEQNLEKATCPVTGFTAGKPTLTKVPSLPFLGTLFHLYSGTPKLNTFDMYNYSAEYRKRFGDFYTMGLPGLGAGLHGTVHVTTDPSEIAKVVKSEGAYPSGAVERLWFFHKVLKDLESPLVEGDDYGLFDNGTRWKKHRRFLQTGMLDPKAAKRFVPGIQEAARLASKGAPTRKNDLNLYLSHCAFDMFNTFMLGEFSRCADTGARTKENNENIQFCEATIKTMSLSGEFLLNPYHMFMVETLGIKTKKYKEFEEAWSVVNEIGTRKIRTFIDRYERGELNDVEKASYLAGAIERQAADDSEVTKEEMIALCLSSLIAAVDTTSNVMSWCIVNLAVHPEVQEKLFTELSSKSLASDGRLTDKITERSSFPYLHAVLRESFRITPIGPQTLTKSNTHSDIDIHGITFPKGTVFALDNIGNDVRYFPDADQFKPERWFAAGVEERKGTANEILDHPFFRDPFGQGARRCPGSRVATNEVLSMVSQLVLDYKIEAKEKSISEIVHESRLFITPVRPMFEFIPR